MVKIANIWGFGRERRCTSRGSVINILLDYNFIAIVGTVGQHSSTNTVTECGVRWQAY